MTDIFDRAQELEALQREQALARQREKTAQFDPVQWDHLSAKWCEAPGCGERIPDARRKAIPGARYCVDCQARLELEGRQRR